MNIKTSGNIITIKSPILNIFNKYLFKNFYEMIKLYILIVYKKEYR